MSRTSVCVCVRTRMCVHVLLSAHTLRGRFVPWLVLVCTYEDDTAELLQELQRITRELAVEQTQKMCCL